ncbi:aldehyde dehydrogenase family protein [Kaistia terrae]|uniref:aldehyde dehydrogenase (NAD(+)) n=1 Tax=Kaistia terrae TaxID=537017 RepID=A0ABW0PU30_9HYPH|nr:aldehyde dehydrogenase family protein [Kaistia terrae]MCX5578446.1 aldehyde dehydrogenase family protein [Kaistia terrae]
MSNLLKFYIDGQWVDPVTPNTIDVINPATEEAFATISLGSAADVDKAVKAARAAFPAFSATSKAERLALLKRVAEVYASRLDEIGDTIRQEIGAPTTFARDAQAGVGVAHLESAIKALEELEFESWQGTTRIVKEPIGVVGLITPWNWPINQIALKVAPALAVGSTIVLKPSEISPLSAILFAEILHEAGVPAGVFNLVNGDGATVGEAISAHPDIDMVSFTGSTRAGILVAKAAADTIKRVSQELGGKSANIVLADADLKDAVSKGVAGAYLNNGQSCAAPTRLFVPESRKEEAYAIAREAAEAFKVGDPSDPATQLGPVVSQVQFDRVQRLIEAGIAEGARLITGGPGRPNGLNRGYYIQPTVFGDVLPSHSIAREEIFGPVLSILTYRDEEEAIELANDSIYGLAAYVQAGDRDRAAVIARRLRAGQVSINYPGWDSSAPFGGYKRSGNGREGGPFGLHEFLEVKAILGDQAA